MCSNDGTVNAGDIIQDTAVNLSVAGLALGLHVLFDRYAALHEVQGEIKREDLCEQRS